MATQFEAWFLAGSEHEAWDAFVLRARCGTIFQQSAWVRLIAEVFGRRPRILGVRRNGLLVGGCPLYERRVLGLPFADPPVLAGYTSVLVDLPESQRAGRLTSETEQILAALEAALHREFAHVRLVNDPELLDARPFLWSGWAVTPRFTYRLPPVPPDARLQQFEHNVRKKIRKAQEAGFTVHQVDGIDEVLATYAQAYRRHGTAPPVPQAILRAVVERVLAAGLGRAYVVRDAGGTSHGFQLLLLDRAHAYALFAGADPECLREGGFSLLLSHLLDDLSATCHVFDFMGANTPPIAAFKRSFGGTLVAYWETSRATLPARALLAARSLAARARAVIGRSPAPTD